jgi:hypothetical protein
LDPKPIPGVSEYSVFNNNPIWYSDPLGDTLSNPQLLDALKIGYNTVQSHLDKRTFNIGIDYSAEVNKAVIAYEEKNKLDFGDFAAFQQQAFDYYKGFKEVAGSYGGGTTMSEYGNKVLSLANESNEAVIIRTTQSLINAKNGQYGTIVQQTMRIVPIALDAGVPVEVGPGPRGTMISSATQRALVESKAGFKFTETTLNRYIDPARTVDAADLRTVVGTKGYPDPQGASGATAHYGTILRNGKAYNLKVVYNAENNTIYHFHYSRAAMGPLPKIPK